MRSLKMILLLLVPTFVFSQKTYTYRAPKPLQDGIEVASAKDQSVNVELLEKVVQKIKANDYVNVDALLIIKDDQLILEEYFNDYTQDQLHTQRSISKSITALLAGVALDKGFLPSLDAKMMDYLPKYQSYRKPEHEKITLHHMLSMTTGIEWKESDVQYGTDENDETQMYKRKDWFPYVLSKPVVEEPGTKFEYNGGVANLLAQVIKNATNLSADEFADQHLFTPLGIQEFKWNKSKHTGYVSAAAGVQMRPRDMAKLGLLYLNKGKWKGKQLISQQFMEATMRTQIEGQQLGPFMVDYGYMGLVADPLIDAPGLKDSYVASGNGGQIIWVMPHLDVAIIMTGSNFNNELGQSQPIEIVLQYIYPAVK
ncbi:MAG: serine hydrolase [Bacteroidota bacterium]